MLLMMGRVMKMFVYRSALQLLNLIEFVIDRFCMLYVFCFHKKLFDTLSEYIRETKLLMPQFPCARQYWRAVSIMIIVGKANPMVVCELGGGSTLSFLYFLSKKSTVITLESDSLWLKHVQKWTSGDVRHKFIQSDIVFNGVSVHYKESIPSDCDFVYVDGPPNLIDNVAYPCSDVVNMFGSIVPRTVVVSVRNSTAQLILSHPSAVVYDFSPGTRYAFEKRNVLDFLHFSYHSVFRRNVDSGGCPLKVKPTVLVGALVLLAFMLFHH